MNAPTNLVPGENRSVEFHGRWQEFLGLAAVNLVLTVVTLGIYRFWAQAKVRRYLWSRTSLLGTEMEWTGTGGEMFKGFLMAIGILIGFFVSMAAIGFVVGKWFFLLAIILFYLGMFWAIGFAQFRAMRYRLSRTYWRGIRGGSDDNGVNYGWTALGRNFVAGITAGLAAPWAMTENWNDRVNAMSFGPHPLVSNMDTEGLFKRWLLIYPVYIGMVAYSVMHLPDPAAAQPAEGSVVDSLYFIATIAALGIVLMAYWSLYFRKAAEGFAVSDLNAGFSASTIDWMKFYAKMVGLVVCTLGLGLMVVPYFRWKFVAERLSLYGTIDVDTLTQSTTHAPSEAEGFLDALDIGAF